VALTAAPLRADERIVNYIKGLNAMDERLALILRRLAAGAESRCRGSQEAKSEFMLSRWKKRRAQRRPSGCGAARYAPRREVAGGAACR